MKSTVVAAAVAALVGGATASVGDAGHRHAHELFHAAKRGAAHNESETCVPGCTTYYYTTTGEGTLYNPPPTSTPPPPPPTTTAAPTVPTPIVYTCPTPGTYSFPATTLTVTETTTVCAGSTTTVPSGTHTVGGITTVVETETTIVCPYATTSSCPTGVTSVIETTTYVCPSAGTYTIAPITVTVEEVETVVVVPVVTTYCPATYTAPAIVTVVETDTVIYCPFAMSTESAAPAAPTGSPAPAPAPASAAPAKSGGGQWSLTYTPYDSSGGCKSADQVTADITAIAAAGFTTLRLYSTDCSTLPNVGAACQSLGLKVIVGIFIGEPGVCNIGSSDVSTQVEAITSWAQWGMVEMVVVANEAMFNGYCTVGELKQLIVDVRSSLSGAGYTGPFTTTDVVSAWQESGTSDLCTVIDAISTNCHAFFNPDTTADQAGPFVQSQLTIVEGVCPGLPAYVLESGWPHDGSGCNGVACPGASEQATALASIQSTMGNQVAFFSFCDDPWKQPGDYGVEQYWGCGDHWGAN